MPPRRTAHQGRPATQAPEPTPDTSALLRELIAHNHLEIGRADGKAAVLLATAGSLLSPAIGPKTHSCSLDAVAVVVRRAHRRGSRRGTPSGSSSRAGNPLCVRACGTRVLRGRGVCAENQARLSTALEDSTKSAGTPAAASPPRHQPDRAPQEPLRALGRPPPSPHPARDPGDPSSRQLIKVSRQGLPGLLGVSRNRHASVFSSRANASGGRGSGSRLGITISPGAGSCSYGPVRQYERLSPGRICPVGLIFMPARPPAACLGMPSSSPIGVLGQNFHRPRRGSPSLARHCGPT